MDLPAFRSLHFTANEDDVRRAALLNELDGNLRALFQFLRNQSIVESFTAGAGMVNSGDETDPVADIVALDGTIIVEDDGIKVGVIGAENIEDDAIVDDVELAAAVQPIRLEVEKLRILVLQLVKLEMGGNLDNGWEAAGA